MRIGLTGIIAGMVLAGSVACFWTGNDAPSESAATPDINATISAAVAQAVEKELGRTESAPPTQMAVTPVSGSGQTNWLAGLSQFNRIKVARDEVDCIGYDGGRYTSSHTIIRVDDGFYALGNPGAAVAFYDNNSGCRIGVITDETLE